MIDYGFGLSWFFFILAIVERASICQFPDHKYFSFIAYRRLSEISRLLLYCKHHCFALSCRNNVSGKYTNTLTCKRHKSLHGLTRGEIRRVFVMPWQYITKWYSLQLQDQNAFYYLHVMPIYVGYPLIKSITSRWCSHKCHVCHYIDVLLLSHDKYVYDQCMSSSTHTLTFITMLYM